jgi:hypothetical protein
LGLYLSVQAQVLREVLPTRPRSNPARDPIIWVYPVPRRSNRGALIPLDRRHFFNMFAWEFLSQASLPQSSLPFNPP